MSPTILLPLYIDSEVAYLHLCIHAVWFPKPLRNQSGIQQDRIYCKFRKRNETQIHAYATPYTHKKAIKWVPELCFTEVLSFLQTGDEV